MPDQPLQPFLSPTAFFDQFNLSSYLPSGLGAGVVVEWALYAIFAFWALYTLVATYHWLKYSHDSWLAYPAIALHFFISISLMSYVLSGNAFFLTSYLP